MSVWLEHRHSMMLDRTSSCHPFSLEISSLSSATCHECCTVQRAMSPVSCGSPALMHARSLPVHPDLSLPVDSVKVHDDPAVGAWCPARWDSEHAPVEHAQHAHVERRGNTCSMSTKVRQLQGCTCFSQACKAKPGQPCSCRGDTTRWSHLTGQTEWGREQ